MHLCKPVWVINKSDEEQPSIKSALGIVAINKVITTTHHGDTIIIIGVYPGDVGSLVDKQITLIVSSSEIRWREFRSAR